MDWKAARRAWMSYQGAGAGVRAFLVARMAVAPLGPLDHEFRALRGRVLSLGCGHGVVDRYLAEVNPDVMVDGFDLDEERVRIAQRSAYRSPRVRVSAQDVTRLEADGGYDAALAIDVLHHIQAKKHGEMARVLLQLLRPGGALLVKEMASSPKRRYLWNRLHDRIVAGREPIYCYEPEELAGLLQDAGFEIEDVRRLQRLRLYPQYLVRARRPA